ncbi:hypothetical protein [Haloplanus halobius]|uniref:hypothetical protein n=1 Tax=Haloplanus halobius TaxID=2934938 RepID=UPI00200C35AC|nr:hypothetical protein [Haloplanus sp. XH21]
MHRREALRTGAIAGVAALAGCFSVPDDDGFHESFEDGMGDWTPDAAIGPEVDVDEFEWTVEVDDAQAAGGERSLRIWNEGDYDDGVTWAVHPIAIDPAQANEIEVSVQFWSESESFNTIRDAVVRLGPEPPETEADFPDPGVNTAALDETPYGGLREPLWLADGWREYAFEWTTPDRSAETLYLAVGTSVIWEADATHFVDDITVDTDE